jgi:hypothetical protein
MANQVEGASREKRSTTVSKSKENLSSVVDGLERLVLMVGEPDAPNSSNVKIELEKARTPNIPVATLLQELPKSLDMFAERVTAATEKLREYLI